jgi:maltooligosyltrehalose synthase
VQEGPIQDRIPSVLAAVAKDIGATRWFPESTYRLQFHAGFTFRDALHLVPYLHTLSITHCYASPFLQAWPGSTHGYDVTSLELSIRKPARQRMRGPLQDLAGPWHGTGAGYCAQSQSHGHHRERQPVWNDVLENDPALPYAMFFDIAWDVSPRAERHDQVLLPTLGELYGHALESQQIRLAYGRWHLTWLALNYRRTHPGLFSAGDYVPMPAIGAKREQVFAFARCRGAEAAIVVAPRLFARLLPRRYFT